MQHLACLAVCYLKMLSCRLVCTLILIQNRITDVTQLYVIRLDNALCASKYVKASSLEPPPPPPPPPFLNIL